MAQYGFLWRSAKNNDNLRYRAWHTYRALPGGRCRNVDIRHFGRARTCHVGNVSAPPSRHHHALPSTCPANSQARAPSLQLFYRYPLRLHVP